MTSRLSTRTVTIARPFLWLPALLLASCGDDPLRYIPPAERSLL